MTVLATFVLIVATGYVTAATVSVGHTLKRPSVSAAGGVINEKRCARSGPSTVDSV